MTPWQLSSQPDPASSTTPAEFTAMLRQLKNVTGHSYRQLERRAAERADNLPRTTLMTALNRDRLPRDELVAGFVRACGRGEEVDDWLVAHRRLAADLKGVGPSKPQPPESRLMPPIWYQLGRLGKMVGVATVVLVVVTIAALARILIPV